MSGEDWFRVVDYPLPTGWMKDGKEIQSAPVVFKVQATYPTAPPYGFSLPAGVLFGGTNPNNCCAAPQNPFEGSWTQFSWQPEDTWTPTNETARGSNLLSWVRSFGQRLLQGV
jgi:hypothetical protein